MKRRAISVLLLLLVFSTGGIEAADATGAVR
jgi:hypothetical protein